MGLALGTSSPDIVLPSNMCNPGVAKSFHIHMW